MNLINGLKLWSINNNYIESAIKLFKKNIYSYIEIYIKPGSFKDYINIWGNLNIPFIIHAPHFGDGLNFSLKEKFDSNKKMALESIEFTERLKAKYIIFHPGVNGDIKETINQLKQINDKRVIIENKPHFGLNNENCIGHSPNDIKMIIEETGFGFCLDIGHAICSANSKNINPLDYIESFIDLKPVMYHLTDGDYYSQYDSHLHFGEGNYPIKEIVKMIKPEKMVTNEAKKKSLDNLDDFIIDMEYLKKIDN